MQENMYDQNEEVNRQKVGEKDLVVSSHPLIHVPEYAIVRVSDGRVGYKTHAGRQHYVNFANGEKSTRAYDERVEIVISADEVAQRYVSLLTFTAKWYEHLREDPAPRTASWTRDKWKLLAQAEKELQIPEAQRSPTTVWLSEKEKL